MNNTENRMRAHFATKIIHIEQQINKETFARDVLLYNKTPRTTECTVVASPLFLWNIWIIFNSYFKITNVQKDARENSIFYLV